MKGGRADGRKGRLPQATLLPASFGGGHDFAIVKSHLLLKGFLSCRCVNSVLNSSCDVCKVDTDVCIERGLTAFNSEVYLSLLIF